MSIYCMLDRDTVPQGHRKGWHRRGPCFHRRKFCFAEWWRQERHISKSTNVQRRLVGWIKVPMAIYVLVSRVYKCGLIWERSLPVLLGICRWGVHPALCRWTSNVIVRSLVRDRMASHRRSRMRCAVGQGHRHRLGKPPIARRDQKHVPREPPKN